MRAALVTLRLFIRILAQVRTLGPAIAANETSIVACVTGCPEYLFAPLPHAREQTHGSRFQGSGIL